MLGVLSRFSRQLALKSAKLGQDGTEMAPSWAQVGAKKGSRGRSWGQDGGKLGSGGGKTSEGDKTSLDSEPENRGSAAEAPLPPTSARFSSSG